MQTLKSNYFSQLRNNKTLRNSEKYVNTTFRTFCCLQSSKYFLRYLETAAFSPDNSASKASKDSDISSLIDDIVLFFNCVA